MNVPAKRDSHGRLLPGYLLKLSEHLIEERGEMLQEVSELLQGMEHMKAVIAMQQSQARVSGVTLPPLPCESSSAARRAFSSLRAPRSTS